MIISLRAGRVVARVRPPNSSYTFVAQIEIPREYQRFFDYEGLDGREATATVVSLQKAYERLMYRTKSGRGIAVGHVCSKLHLWATWYPEGTWRVER